MFSVNASPTFKATVKFGTPDGEASFKVIFKHKGRKALAEFVQSLTAEDAGRTDFEALTEIIVAWEDVKEPYSKDALEQMLDNYPTAAKAFFDAYFPALTEGARKN